MKIVDFFLHPVLSPTEDDLFTISSSLLTSNLAAIRHQMKATGVDAGMLAVFESKAANQVMSAVGDQSDLAVTVLAEFHDPDGIERLAELAKQGVRSITFHPYLQDLSRHDWPRAIAYAQEAERLGLFIVVCTAYGSRKIYSVEVLPFAVALAETVSCPVIFAHGGGARVLDAMLIADAYQNVWLETSFSLPYWLGSSIEQDIAFTMRKIGVGRWLYGSDAPFIPMNQALSDHFDFFRRHHFSTGEIEAIMGLNATRLLDMRC